MSLGVCGTVLGVPVRIWTMIKEGMLRQTRYIQSLFTVENSVQRFGGISTVQNQHTALTNRSFL
jgi:hypothetical protein